jgi:polyhydroxyalkanoate synthesis regulator phasin
MGDSFTNVLLITLITLLGYIGKVFYDKMEDVLKRIEQILLSDVSQKKDIENLKEDMEDHETRITHLENK